MHFKLHRTRNRVTNFEKVHVFMTLSPKIVFEKTQIACSLIMKFVTFMHTLFIFCKKNFNLYMPKR
jgi:hypothetical protein